MSMSDLIAVGRGLKPADLLLKNARLVDVLSGEILDTDVALHAGKIAGFGAYDSQETMDLEGRFLCPGFIDGHIHVESTMLVPPEFARTVSPLGTTAVVIDPHEIANVLGIDGINYMLRVSAGLPVTFYVMLPSCVPATNMETSGAELNSGDLALLLPRKRVIGIAEMMNYPGVLAGDHEVLNKIRLAGYRRVDGHAPGLTGKDLSAYIGAGISSDHECVSADEAREKLRLGMHIMVREGTTEKNLKELVHIITPENSRRFSLVTDDRHPGDLLQEGHIDHCIRLAIGEGVPPVTAIQMATINTAAYFGIRGIGAVAPGYQADLTVLDDLEKVTVSRVIKQGDVVADRGRALHFDAEPAALGIRGTVNIDNASLEDLSVPAGDGQMKVIGIVPGQIVTQKLLVDPKVEGGKVVSDIDRDVVKIAVVERHKASGNVGLGFIKGMGLKRGALATSVAHDSHNVIAVGASDEDIRRAVIEIARMNGGAVVVDGGQVLARLPLPVAGLMSDQPAPGVAAAVNEVIGAAYDLGCVLPDPLISLSFMALPVIPELKLTDRGLVDVTAFSLTGLFGE